MQLYRTAYRIPPPPQKASWLSITTSLLSLAYHDDTFIQYEVCFCKGSDPREMITVFCGPDQENTPDSLSVLSKKGAVKPPLLGCIGFNVYNITPLNYF